MKARESMIAFTVVTEDHIFSPNKALLTGARLMYGLPFAFFSTDNNPIMPMITITIMMAARTYLAFLDFCVTVAILSCHPRTDVFMLLLFFSKLSAAFTRREKRLVTTEIYAVHLVYLTSKTVTVNLVFL